MQTTSQSFVSQKVIPLAIALAGGLLISAVDNFAAGGEISPLMILPLLVVGAALLGGVWGFRAAPALVCFWFPLPAAHAVKRILGLRDTLHPNTYASIAMLAIFSFGLCAVTFGIASGIRRLATRRS